MTKRVTLRQRIEALLDEQERSVQRSFEQYLRKIRDREILEQVADLLEQNRVREALDLLASQENDLRQALFALLTAAAAFEVAIWRARTPRRRALIIFDPAGDEMLETFRESAGLFSQQMRETNRNTLQTVLQRINRGELSRTGLRDLLERNVGLQRDDLLANENYRRLLERGSLAALERAARDPRFDERVTEARDKPLTQRQIDVMVNRYARNQARNRGRRIARTMATRLSSQARRIAFTQVLGQMGVSSGLATHTWFSQRDARVRRTHSHVSLDGQTQPLNQPFVSISGARLRYPGDPAAPPNEVINCRCYEVFRIRNNALGAPASRQ